MAYASDFSGGPEVYVQATGGGGRRYQVSTDGGHSPHWSPDGRTIYFVSGATLMAASVVAAPEFRVSSREEVFGGMTDTHAYTVNYDVHPGGEEVLVIGQRGGPGSSRIVWTLDWMEIVRDMAAGN
jgi:hypothetical protein